MVEGDWAAERQDLVRLPNVNFKPTSEIPVVKKRLTFLDNGTETNTQYGPSIRFTVLENDEKKNFWVKPKQYSLLNVFAPLVKEGKLRGSIIEITRFGEKQSDTRWKAEVVGTANTDFVNADQLPRKVFG